MASGDDYQTLWLPNAYMREQATVPEARDLSDCAGFMPAHYEYTMSNGERHYALTNQKDFQRVLDGRACPKCLAMFKSYRENCCVCDWEKDFSRDIIEQVPPEWLPESDAA